METHLSLICLCPIINFTAVRNRYILRSAKSIWIMQACFINYIIMVYVVLLMIGFEYICQQAAIYYSWWSYFQRKLPVVFIRDQCYRPSSISVIGPLLFLLYVNDFAKVCHLIKPSSFLLTIGLLINILQIKIHILDC